MSQPDASGFQPLDGAVGVGAKPHGREPCRLEQSFARVVAKRARLQIRINAGDKAALVAAADWAGLSLSAWAKQVLLRAAKRQSK